MASSLDQWMREFNEASKLSEDISAMMSERGSLPPSGPDTQRHLTAMRRKITILRTRLDSLESLLSKLPSMQPMYVFPIPTSSHYSPKEYFCFCFLLVITAALLPFF